MGETRKAPPSQKYTAWPQERCSGAGKGWEVPLCTGGVLWAQADTCPSSIGAVEMGGGGLDSLVQARIPSSRKGADAMVPRCHVGKEFVRRTDQRINSRDWHQKAKSTCLGPGAGRGEKKERRREGAAQGGTEQREGAAVSPVAVSFRAGQGGCRPQGQERGCWAQACWPPPACRR